MKKNFPITGNEVQYPANTNILSTTDTKGIITYINQDFINISGFEESELLGQSHNIVRHPEMPPAAFEDLWKTLKADESWMGIVKNRCKNGDHYWVDAFVTPIIRNGQVVEYQSVRTKPKREYVERAEKVYAQLMTGKVPGKLKSPKFNLSTRLNLAFLLAILPVLLAGPLLKLISWPVAGLGFLVTAILGVGLNLFMIQPMCKAVRHSRQQVTNPIARYIYTGRNDELGDLMLAQKMATSEMSGITGRISDSAQQLTTTSGKLEHNVELNNQGIQHQHSETDQVATAINEMSASIQEVASNAVLTSETVNQADAAAREGKQVVEETVNKIRHLNDEVIKATDIIHDLDDNSDNISTVLDVIKGIAEQTNLLALNAAIEAARAGEQGRGFAVVADEVRTLASRTHDSTSEIQKMIEVLQKSAQDAVAAMGKSRVEATESVEITDKALAALDSITSSMGQISDMSTQIATAVEEQSAVAEEVNRSITSITDVIEVNTETANETMGVSQKMSSLASGLTELVDQFWQKRTKED